MDSLLRMKNNSANVEMALFPAKRNAESTTDPNGRIQKLLASFLNKPDENKNWSVNTYLQNY